MLLAEESRMRQTSLLRSSAALVALALPALLGAQASRSVASVVPTPTAPMPAAPAPAVALPANAVRIVDRAPDGAERGWLAVEVDRVSSGLVVTVSRAAFPMASANARVVQVRALVIDADTSRGMKIHAASAPVAAARLAGCVDGTLGSVVRFVVPTDMSPEALRTRRLAFELVGHVKAPGERRWSGIAERVLPGPMLAQR
jgi:hypothetical protein